MAVWQVVCGLCAVMCVAETRIRPEPFSSFKAPRETILNYQTVSPLIEWTYHDSTRQLMVAIRSRSTQYTLKLQLNEGLLSPTFSSRSHDQAGREDIQMGHRNCFYHGEVVEEPGWTAVLSTCLGLRGSFGPRGDPALQYHIEPLHHHLGSTDLTQPHVLYLGSEYRITSGTCGSMGHGGGVSEISHHQITSQDRQRLRRQGRFVAIVEWTLVNDNAQYLAFSRNLTHVVLRAIEIANGVDMVFKAVGVRLVVVDVVTWTMGDPIQISDVPDVILNDFRAFSPNLPQIYDSAMLFTGIELNGTTIGIAYTATLCEYLRSSVGVVQDGGAEMDQLISTTAHELGHIFAMIHDTPTCSCTDPTDTCIMEARIGNPPPTTWSSCSVETLQTTLGGVLGMCLYNSPVSTVSDPSCGNGILEQGEQCDCGSDEECTDSCCNSTSCQLIAGAQCKGGPCCLPSCQFRPYGSVCRHNSNECDIEEYCTGDSGDCPRNSFLQNLTPCMANESFCFSGHCQTRENQCQHHFGAGDAIDACYTRVNTLGNVFGHCGVSETDYLPCSEENAFCGQIQCGGDGELLTTPGIPVRFTLRSESFTCNSVTSRIGEDEVSPGLIRDGTKCGDFMICLNSECVNASVVKGPPCPVGSNGEVCSGQGQCNNENKCSCSVGFSGSQCEDIYVGNGEREQGGGNAGAIAGAVVAVIVILAIAGGITGAVIFFVVRSRSPSYIARRYIPKTPRSGAQSTNNVARNGRVPPPVTQQTNRPPKPPTPTRPNTSAPPRPLPPTVTKTSPAPQRPLPPSRPPPAANRPPRPLPPADRMPHPAESIPSADRPSRPPPPYAKLNPPTGAPSNSTGSGGVKPTPAPKPVKTTR